MRSATSNSNSCECRNNHHFVTYLAGHNRPIHEVLFGNDKDIEDD
jgi:hypothetical protein